MLKTCAFMFLLCIHNRIAEQCCKTVEDTELVMAFLVHRHGDRTPLKQLLNLSDDPKQFAKLSEPYGYGQLTNIGKARSFALGQLLRRRYDQLFSPSFNSSDFFLRATDSDRTQMTAKIAMTAVYSPEDQWSEDMELLPLEMNVVSHDDDPNLPFVNCPQLWSCMSSQAENENPKEMKMYDKDIELLSQELGFNLMNKPMVLYVLADLFACQLSLGLPLSNLRQKLMPHIQEGGDKAVDYVFGNEICVPLQAGVLLKEFFDIADMIISGTNIPRVRILSAHDYNVYSFTAVSKAVPKQGIPRYCAVFSLELRKCKCSGKYVVLPVYVKSPDEPVIYLEIEDCEVICDYEKFREITSKYILTEQLLKIKCRSNDTQPHLALIL